MLNGLNWFQRENYKRNRNKFEQQQANKKWMNDFIDLLSILTNNFYCPISHPPSVQSNIQWFYYRLILTSWNMNFKMLFHNLPLIFFLLLSLPVMFYANWMQKVFFPVPLHLFDIKLSLECTICTLHIVSRV